MNKVNLWLKELRSGRYKQCQGCMRNSEGFDPLGVLCDIYQQIHGTLKVCKHRFINIDDEYEEAWSYNKRFSQVPDEVREWMGLSTCDGSYCEIINKQEEELTLSYLNDCGCSLMQLATIIESKPKGLFHVGN